MEAELVGYSIDGCYKYHHDKHLKLGMFIRGKETGELKVVSFEEKQENEVFDASFDSNMVLQETTLKDLPQLILNFRNVRVANSFNLQSRKSIYVVGMDYFLQKQIIYRSGMTNIYSIRQYLIFIYMYIQIFNIYINYINMFKLGISYLVWERYPWSFQV